MSTATAAHRVTETVAGSPRSVAVSAYRPTTAAAPAATSTGPRRRPGRPARSPASAAVNTAPPTSHGNQIALRQMVGTPDHS